MLSGEFEFYNTPKLLSPTYAQSISLITCKLISVLGIFFLNFNDTKN